MKNKALSTIIKHHMLTCGDKVTVGLSGGADSVALLVFLCELREEFQLELAACHVNHLLRGEESQRDEAFAQELCAKLNVPIHVYQVDVPSYSKTHRLSIELAARQLRYEAFADCAGTGLIATAHTLSDNLETILLSMGRGTGLKGLTGIPPKRDKIIRPLLDCTRQEVEEYLALREISFVIDSSNFSDDYSRNKLRNHVIPALKAALPEIEGAVGRMTQLLAEDQSYLEACCARSMEQIATSQGYSRAGYLALHSAIRSRILIKILQEQGFDYSHLRVKLLEDTITLGSGRVELGREWYFEVCESSFAVVHRPSWEQTVLSPLSFPKDTLDGTVAEFGGKIIRLRITDPNPIKKVEISNKKNTTFALDYDKIQRVLFIRTRLEQDKISLYGRGCTKSLKKLYNEQKIPLHIRNSLAVFADEAGVLAVEGCGLAERSAPGPLTQKILWIEIDNKG